jgi:cold shock CspA family protein/ribosome-associated translation inhibitor RaiA
MTTLPVQISFHGLAHSEPIEADIRERIAWLEEYYPAIVGCRVAVEVPHRHRHDGRHFHVRVELTVPGSPPIVVSHEPSQHGPLKDAEEPAHRKGSEVVAIDRYARAAVHDAFDRARRRLQDVAREQRGVVKAHVTPPHGVVAEISRRDGFGFILAGERLVYFNRASVLHDAFDALEVGTQVAFAEELGDKGPQASSVRVLGKHHYAEP